MKTNAQIPPIELEIIHNALTATAAEMVPNGQATNKIK